ncbi:hypothetical protein CGLO_00062 [Colletotrichum gloeosporioides Cg-14]|uniref:Uncharacterized protein n=1 Tax=Colletotrichum gloeosporioides (strain Cg-14) TaxID=1237896 RepID=T0L498_COLGC|nr:hypothetical protein CGLO_00062 [Colletotrichum gloeosporioides Cg-14]
MLKLNKICIYYVCRLKKKRKR